MTKNKITEKELLKELDASFKELALGDMKNALEGNTNLAVFILGACFIDALGGFYYGKKDTKPGGDKDRFRGFVRKYLKQYNPDDLYTSLRCGLVHSYVVDGRYAFTNKKKKQHLRLTPKRSLEIVNDENFYRDLENAYYKFKNDILKHPTIFKRARKRYKTLKIMKIALIENC